MTIGCWAKAAPASMTLVAAIAIIAKRNLLRMFPPNLLDCPLSRPAIRLVSSLFCSHFRPSFKLTLPRLDKRPPRAHLVAPPPYPPPHAGEGREGGPRASLLRPPYRVFSADASLAAVLRIHARKAATFGRS